MIAKDLIAKDLKNLKRANSAIDKAEGAEGKEENTLKKAVNEGNPFPLILGMLSSAIQLGKGLGAPGVSLASALSNDKLSSMFARLLRARQGQVIARGRILILAKGRGDSNSFFSWGRQSKVGGQELALKWRKTATF